MTRLLSLAAVAGIITRVGEQVPVTVRVTEIAAVDLAGSGILIATHAALRRLGAGGARRVAAAVSRRHRHAKLAAALFTIGTSVGWLHGACRAPVHAPAGRKPASTAQPESTSTSEATDASVLHHVFERKETSDQKDRGQRPSRDAPHRAEVSPQPPLKM